MFEQKISQIEPALGIELFLLEAPVVEDLANPQEALRDINGGNKMVVIAELLDRLASRSGSDSIHRYLPAEHHWPERVMEKTTTDLADSFSDIGITVIQGDMQDDVSKSQRTGMIGLTKTANFFAGFQPRYLIALQEDEYLVNLDGETIYRGLYDDLLVNNSYFAEIFKQNILNGLTKSLSK
ncbi:hypothetical protein LZD49_32215 [Dyadobacter sp. CY261]|uniref:hypothetical protein n=1 Tax=Dyadobacter sp. CY261 TaxID=2907203 RepID=UPI001F3FC0D5|nr:hypothetical protein [Dyadobacter sp. CY261]MCF0075192.1 hypothetical protein [Dyadobacter sp. CY261]